MEGAVHYCNALPHPVRRSGRILARKGSNYHVLKL